MQIECEVRLLGGESLPYPPPGIPSVPQGKTHIIQAGETLSEISRSCFGSPGYWDVIVTNNPTAIRDPNVLTVGTKLIIG